MLRKILLGSLLIFGFIFTYAQTDSTKITTAAAPEEPKPGPAITGSVDVYYRYNFDNPKSGNLNNFTSFTNSQNSFELGMASVKVDHSFGKASGTIDLGFGR